MGYLAYLHQLFGRCQDYIIQAQLLENKTWLLTNYSGIKQEYQLLGDSFVSRHWVIMRFCNDRVIARKKKTIILVKHRQPKDTWRTLQVYLRYLNKKI